MTLHSGLELLSWSLYIVTAAGATLGREEGRTRSLLICRPAEQTACGTPERGDLRVPHSMYG